MARLKINKNEGDHFKTEFNTKKGCKHILKEITMRYANCVNIYEHTIFIETIGAT